MLFVTLELESVHQLEYQIFGDYQNNKPSKFSVRLILYKTLIYTEDQKVFGL